MGTYGLYSGGGYSPGYSGSYGLTSSGLCTVCNSPARTGCLSGGCYMMAGVWTCISGSASSAGFPCPSGYWCPGGAGAAGAPQPCPRGTYYPGNGALSNQCEPCPGMLTTLQPGAPNASACVCPAGSLPIADSSPPKCAAEAGAAAAAASAPPPSGWEQFQAVLIPLLSVLGALATYVTVGDRLLGACAPALHARLWQGAAGWMAHTAAPACRRSRCCPARGAALLESAAAGILKGLADLAEARRKTALAQKTLTRAPAAGGGGGGGAAAAALEAPVAAGSAGGRAALATVGNPLLQGAAGAAAAAGSAPAPGGAASSGGGTAPAPAPSKWTRHSDGTDVWYSSVETGEVAWDLPAGAALVAGEVPPAGEGEGAGSGSGSGVVWQRHSDEADVWYVSSEGETAWDLPAGAVLRQ